QAEDGIRDLIVTGVQTCALPIFTNEDDIFGRAVVCEDSVITIVDAAARRRQRNFTNSILLRSLFVIARLDDLSVPETKYQDEHRSEERRVGKSVGVGVGRT